MHTYKELMKQMKSIAVYVAVGLIVFLKTDIRHSVNSDLSFKPVGVIGNIFAFSSSCYETR